jgi:hypothetical protein
VIDSATHNRITVSTDGNAGPYIMVPVDQLDMVTALLRDNAIAFWVDADAISLDGKPEIVVINLGRGVDATRVQRLLDQAK